MYTSEIINNIFKKTLPSNVKTDIAHTGNKVQYKFNLKDKTFYEEQQRIFCTELFVLPTMTLKIV